jgi:hypothetical protein
MFSNQRMFGCDAARPVGKSTGRKRVRTFCRQATVVLRSPMSAGMSECHIHRRKKINIACVLKQEICEMLLKSGSRRAKMRLMLGRRWPSGAAVHRGGLASRGK